MTEKKSYFKTVLRRDNSIAIAILNFFLLFASYSRLLFEVFIRKNFGQRYFKFSSVLTVTVILGCWPLVSQGLSGLTNAGFSSMPTQSLMSQYLTWYIFLGLFVIFGIIRYREVANGPSVYDFKKYSLYSGHIHPYFLKLKIGNGEPSERLIETLLEPLPFFILGILLSLFGQKLGGLLILCSILYGMSYVAAYDKGDNFIMDKIDEIICNEALQEIFSKGMADRKRTDVPIRTTRRPVDEETRKKIADMMANEFDGVAEAE